MDFKSSQEVLDFAIEKEEESRQFYLNLADQTAPSHMKKVFREFAAEEEQHKKKLQNVKSGETTLLSREKVTDLKLSDYLPDVQPAPQLNYQQALIIAMKAEKAAFRLYSDLAERTTNSDLKSLFLSLAQEEARHKLRFEIEYDEHVLREN